MVNAKRGEKGRSATMAAILRVLSFHDKQAITEGQLVKLSSEEMHIDSLKKNLAAASFYIVHQKITEYEIL